MKNIFVSTIAFSNLNINNIIDICKSEDFALEFSSGLKFQKNMEDLYLSAPIKRMPHNYFPASRIPFVLNLASSNDEIRKKSILHCKNGIILAKKSKSPFFAAHAGFCIDPEPEELGNKLNLNNTFNIDLNFKLFLESLIEIIEFSKKNQTAFLIENNVITSTNLLNNKNPLLCCDSDQILLIFEKLKSNYFGLLLDTAHLKVSSNTLNKNLDDEYNKIKPFIKGLHHSDNNGIIDSNDLLNNNYWFLKYCKNHLDIPHVLEVKNLNTKEIKNQYNLLTN